jgi:CubicO group peptidase (beta-lactamase class C family)
MGKFAKGILSALLCAFLGVSVLAVHAAGGPMEFPEGPMPAWFSPLGARAGYVRKSVGLANVLTTSLLVLHEGKTGYERYFYGRDAGTPQAMFSVTKSVVSALVGIAIKEGEIQGVGQKVIDFFPEAGVTDARKRGMTIEHLLTMRSGLPGDTDRQDLRWWDANAFPGKAYDSGLAAFAMPLAAAPGEKFSYSSGPSMQVLACLVSRAVGRNLFDYAQEKLFGPLGMRSVTWDAAGDGANYGGFGISMTPRDMLRFGYLYLNEGRWDGEQLLPEGWVAASAPRGLEDHNGDGYGYLFRAIDRKHGDTYQAQGQFGQFIDISPARNAVIVRTGCAGPFARAAIQALHFFQKAAGGRVQPHWLLSRFEMQGIPLDYLAQAI